VIALTDGTGKIEERYAYSAYGEPIFTNASGTGLGDSAKDNRYTYTGREWDEELSLQHFWARMYSAESGRFLSRDPLAYPEGYSCYPNHFGLSSKDPLGLFSLQQQSPCETLFAAINADSAHPIRRIVRRISGIGNPYKCNVKLFAGLWKQWSRESAWRSDRCY
jgi:RHS repeat-associated protein